jgi:hypothetical protein
LRALAILGTISYQLGSSGNAVRGAQVLFPKFGMYPPINGTFDQNLDTYTRTL